MKQLLYLVMSLVVIAAIIPPASAIIREALYEDTPYSVYVNDSTSLSLLPIVASSGAHTTYCTARGWDAAATNYWYYTTSGTFNNSLEKSYWMKGMAWSSTSGYGNYAFTANTRKAAVNSISCWVNADRSASAHYVEYINARLNENTFVVPTANFTATPLNGTTPFYVKFTDTSTGEPTAWNWSVSPSSGWLVAPGALLTKNPQIYFTSGGNYTIELTASNHAGPDTETKTDYIWAHGLIDLKTKWFQTIDGTNGNIVLNSSIQLKDVENGSWVNATGLTADGMSSITTLQGNHINAYAQALGYSDADDLNLINDGLPRSIMMWPTFAKNVSSGNVSLYVTVKDKDTKANIVGAGVTASLASGSMSTTTNEAGIAYFIVKNSSMVLITAQAIGQGYQTATTTINTGTASGGSASAAATILLGKNTVTPTFPTVTTLPGGGTPAPVITILPGCGDTTSPEGQAKCRAAQGNQGLSFLSGNLLGLIQICFVVTILYLLGIKLGK